MTMYTFAHFLQNRLPFIWTLVEKINEWLFMLRYGKKLHGITPILNKYSDPLIYRQAAEKDINNLIRFFQEQPVDSYKYFTPHKFDEKTIKKLIRNKSYLFFIVLDNEHIVGYYFLRCFFVKKCYLGKLADYRFQGKGIGKTMCLSAMEIARSLGLHMYETISKDNLSSLFSTQNVLDIKIIKEMDNNYIYIEDFPKGTLK